MPLPIRTNKTTAMNDTPSDATLPESNAIVVFRAHVRHDTGILASWAEMARNTWAAREMIGQLLRRDLTAQYKKSYVGILWMLVGPIMAIVPWLVAAKAQVYNPGEIDIPLIVYLVVGRSVWSLFSGFHGAGAGTLAAGGGLLQQINYPHEAMLFKQTIAGLANYLLSFATTIIIMLTNGVYPSWASLLFPLTLIPLFCLGAAIGLFITMIRVVAFDLSRIIDILMGFLMWTTPLLYSDKVSSPILQTVILYNPLSYLVCTSRDVLLHGHVYHNQVGIYFLCSFCALALFLLAMRLFYVSEGKLVERMI